MCFFSEVTFNCCKSGIISSTLVTLKRANTYCCKVTGTIADGWESRIESGHYTAEAGVAAAKYTDVELYK